MMKRLVKRYSLKQNLKYHLRRIYYYTTLTIKTILKQRDEEVYDDYQVFLSHNHCRQRYAGEYPYFYHLKGVEKIALQFATKCNIGYNDLQIVKKIAKGHDLIEDTNLTYQDCKTFFGEDVANGIYACTQLRGRNRKERKGVAFYKELNKGRSYLGKYVKLCDIIFNMNFSLKEYIQKGDKRMITMYVDEYHDLKEKIYKKEDGFDVLYEELEKIIKKFNTSFFKSKI